MIGYKANDPAYPDEQRQALNVPNFDVGSQFDWSAGDDSKEKFRDRVYAIGASAGPSELNDTL